MNLSDAPFKGWLHILARLGRRLQKQDAEGGGAIDEDQRSSEGSARRPMN